MGDWVKRWAEGLRDARRFVTQDVWAIGKPGEEIPKGFIIKQIRVAILLLTNLGEGGLLLRASALTFATTLTIVPFLAVIFFVVHTLNGEGLYQSLRERLESFVAEGRAESSGGGGVVETPPLEDTVPASTEDGRSLESELVRALFRGMGEQNSEFEDPVEWLVGLAGDAATDPRAMSIAGIVLVLATVFGLYRNIEKAFNDVWGVRRTRSWYRMVSDYVMITLLLPPLAVAVLSVTAALQSETISEALGPARLLLQGFQFSVIALVFAGLYYGVPNTPVKIPYALLGGVISSALWVLLSWSYVEFQVGLTKYNLVFAGFAQFPMLLMWVYLSWVILLFGSELSFAYQNEETFAMERYAAGASFAYREALALRLMVEIARRFDQGDSALAPADAAREFNVPTRLLNETLEELQSAGLVRACATEPITYQPGRPLEQITLGDIMTTLREVGREPSLLREDDALKSLTQHSDPTGNAHAKSTLRDVLRRLQDVPAGGAARAGSEEA